MCSFSMAFLVLMKLLRLPHVCVTEFKKCEI